MARSLHILDRVRVASPCSVPWASMTGDERVRYCGLCEKNVYNLSSLTRQDAENLIIEKQGRLCIGYYQRADGTILTADCPVGLAAVRRKTIRAVAWLAAACCAVFFSLAALARGPRGSQNLLIRRYDPFRTVTLRAAWIERQIQDWWSPPQLTQMTLGIFLVDPAARPAQADLTDDEVHQLDLRFPELMTQLSDQGRRSVSRSLIKGGTQ
jgi:hypothetical protein